MQVRFRELCINIRLTKIHDDTGDILANAFNCIGDVISVSLSRDILGSGGVTRSALIVT